MDSEFDKLQNKWESNKKEIELSNDSLDTLYSEIKKKEISSSQSFFLNKYFLLSQI